MKGIQMLQRACCKSKLFLKRNSPTIVTVIGAIGVVATAVTAVKATPKALQRVDEAREKKGEDLTKFEVVRVAGPSYIPAMLIGASTITCIFGANALNKQQQAAITSAYILLDNAFKDYKKKVHTLFGKDSEKLIQNCIVKDKYEQKRVETKSEEFLFFEFHHGDFFERSREEVLHAEYQFNLKFATTGYVTLNDLYEFLNLPSISYGDLLGWSSEEAGDYPWIDFAHELVQLEDGMECHIINYPEPNFDYSYQ